MRDITFAIIGSGFMGSVLARVASELPYAHCVAASDVDFVRAQKLTASYGGKPYDSFDKMLEKHPVDAVFIATPEPLHVAPVQAAAKAGCDIFLEKPIATTMDDALTIIKTCDESGVLLMIGFILRFEVSYALIKNAIDEGSIGRFMSAYARRIAGIGEAFRLGGRVSPVTYIGVHDIDQFLWYHPVPVKSVFAKAVKGRIWEELRTYDSAWITIEFEDGALGVHEVGWCLPEEWAKWKKPAGWSGFGDVRMNVVGTQGNLNLDFTPMDLFGVNREGWKMPDTRHWPVMHGKLVGAAKLEVEHFFNCVLNKKTPIIKSNEALRSLEIMLAAEKSIAENRIINLPLDS